MYEKITVLIGSYVDFYSDYVGKQWHNMTPTKYGVILIGIGVLGWLLMKGGAKH